MTERVQPHTGLSAFLRSRRARLRPEQFGLPTVPKRHTPGLRREELAQLVGVGISWYTWLEQGRDIQVSDHESAATPTLRPLGTCCTRLHCALACVEGPAWR